MIFPVRQHQSCDLKSSLRQVRIIHFLMMAGALFQLYILYTLRSGSSSQPASGTTIPHVFVLVGVIELAALLLVRKLLVEKATITLILDPRDSSAIMRWRAAMVLTSAGIYSAFLYGWVICFLGTLLTWTYYFLWAIAAVGFFVFIPRTPIPEMAVTAPPAQ